MKTFTLAQKNKYMKFGLIFLFVRIPYSMDHTVNDLDFLWITIKLKVSS